MPRKSAAAKAAEALTSGVPEVQAPAIKGVEAGKHSPTVTVACKVPGGIRMQLQHVMQRPVPTGRGVENDFQMIDVNVFGGDIWIAEGPSAPAMGGIPDGYVMPKIESGVALTSGIPRVFFEKWLHQNEQADFVVNGMIYAFGEPRNVKAKARETEKQLSGMEPLSRAVDDKGRLTDRRIPKPLTSSVGRVGHDVDRDAARAGRAE